MPGFRFAARYGLFTYAQSDGLDPHSVVCLFAELGAECIVGRENHVSEGTHLHAFVDFGRRYETTDPRRFDVDGFHPNVSPSRGTPEKGYDYAIKDGDIVAGGLERPQGSGVSESSLVWARIADAPCERDFWELVRALAPRSLLTSFNSLHSYAQWNYRPVRDAYTGPEGVSFDLSGMEEVSEWLRDYGPGNTLNGRPKSLVLWGPTRTGKTLWARSLGRHLYFGGLFNMGELSDIDDAEYAVFDDMQGGFEYFHGYKFWLGGQSEFTVTDKYKGKKHVKWGKPTIWLSNVDPTTEKGLDYEWLMGNAFIVRVEDPFYRLSA
uniref:Replication-associated protein n=1 Tax=Plant associated genomovirus 1 TaxID=2584380 RepID=A0A4Y5QC98_9VIRU|nr:Replication-associated protein [Plant associated genomovirus 1]QCX29351.1 Replication-associated protein [Plant associated genomovirus 1]